MDRQWRRVYHCCSVVCRCFDSAVCGYPTVQFNSAMKNMLAGVLEVKNGPDDTSKLFDMLASAIPLCSRYTSFSIDPMIPETWTHSNCKPLSYRTNQHTATAMRRDRQPVPVLKYCLLKHLLASHALVNNDVDELMYGMISEVDKMYALQNHYCTFAYVQMYTRA